MLQKAKTDAFVLLKFVHLFNIITLISIIIFHFQFWFIYLIVIYSDIIQVIVSQQVFYSVIIKD